MTSAASTRANTLPSEHPAFFTPNWRAERSTEAFPRSPRYAKSISTWRSSRIESSSTESTFTAERNSHPHGASNSRSKRILSHTPTKGQNTESPRSSQRMRKSQGGSTTKECTSPSLPQNTLSSYTRTLSLSETRNTSSSQISIKTCQKTRQW